MKSLPTVTVVESPERHDVFVWLEGGAMMPMDLHPLGPVPLGNWTHVEGSPHVSVNLPVGTLAKPAWRAAVANLRNRGYRVTERPLRVAEYRPHPSRDLLVDTPNPDVLAATLAALGMGRHELTGEVVDGHQVVRSTSPDFARFAIEQQGYATVIGWRDEVASGSIAAALDQVSDRYAQEPVGQPSALPCGHDRWECGEIASSDPHGRIVVRCRLDGTEQHRHQIRDVRSGEIIAEAVERGSAEG